MSRAGSLRSTEARLAPPARVRADGPPPVRDPVLRDRDDPGTQPPARAVVLAVPVGADELDERLLGDILRLAGVQPQPHRERREQRAEPGVELAPDVGRAGSLSDFSSTVVVVVGAEFTSVSSECRSIAEALNDDLLLGRRLPAHRHAAIHSRRHVHGIHEIQVPTWQIVTTAGNSWCRTLGGAVVAGLAA